jgi:hypothetical protein
MLEKPSCLLTIVWLKLGLINRFWVGVISRLNPENLLKLVRCPTQ